MITKPTYWTEPRVLAILEEMIELLNKETNPKTWHIYIGELAMEYHFPREYFSRWAEKYEDNDEIRHALKEIDSILETRINIGAMRGHLQFVPAIFNLKNNYGWKDVQHVDDPTKRAVNDELAEIRIRLAKRTKRNIRNKK